MLNKRIKSLLVAGIVMLGMTGNVFAAEEGLGNAMEPVTKSFESSVTNPFIYSGNEAVFKGGAIVIDAAIEEDTNESQDLYKYNVMWNSVKYKMEKLIITFEDEYSVEIDLTSGSYAGRIEDAEGLEGFKIFKDQTAYKKDLKISEIKVIYSYASDTDEDGIPDFKDDEPVTPPVQPEDPKEPVIKDDPETGDVGIAGLLLAATGIGAGLVVVNKGKDDEEE